MEKLITPQSTIKDTPFSIGLTSNEAHLRLEKFGPNAVPEMVLNPLGRALANFWAPIPWMLEAAIHRN